MSVPFSGIPFPQSGDKSPPLPVAQTPSGSSMQGRLVTASPQMPATGLYSPDYAAGQQDSKPLRQQHYSNASSTSSSSGAGENLPSIRNLLLSIGQDSPKLPSTSLRRSPSAPDRTYYPTVAIDQHHPPPSSRTPPVGATKRDARTASNSAAQPYPWERTDTSPRVVQWDLQAPVRSMSPQRRPPIAMSAFAHSQYIQQQQQQQSHAHRMDAPPGAGIGGPMNQQRNVAVFSRGSKKPRSRHSPSSSIPSVASEDLPDAIHPSLGLWGRGEGPHPGMAQTSHLQKRQSPPTEEQERELAERSPAATRRRHTVGALEEPIHLREAGAGQQHTMQADGKKTSESTPKRHEPLVRAATMRNPNSPATPTAGGMVRHYDVHSGRDSSSGQYYGPPPPSIHRVYMQQHADAGNNSMPSLTSSVSSTSLVSERLRKHSLEEAGDRRMVPGGGWLPHMSPMGNAAGFPHVKPSGGVGESMVMSSPRSSVWHSRSSTLDSVVTTSSMASSQARAYARPLPPPRSSSLRFEEESSMGQPVTPTGRSRDPSASSHRDDSLDSRRRHESLRDGMQAARPYHPFPSQESMLSQESNNNHMRQRAQTMTYQDRRIAPLPSHSQTSLHHYSASNASSPYSGRPGRSNSSLSVSSVASLPQRVSSMEIDTEQGRARRYHEHATRSPPSSSMALSHSQSQSTIGSLPMIGHSPFSSHAAGVGSGNIVITSSGGSASAGSKYECGWCGKRFSRPSSLKIHHHSHTGEKPFACPAPGCGRTFSVQSNLRRHQKCHSVAITNASKAAASQLDSSSSASRDMKEGGQSGAFGLSAGHYSPPDAAHRLKDVSAGASGLARVSSTSRPSGQQDKLGRVGQASSFARSRERRPSLGSSNAEDDADREYEEDDEEDIDEDEDEGEMDDDDSTTRGDKTGLLESHHVDVGMQDIQEESEASHSADRRHFHPSEPMAEQAMSTQH